MAAFFGGATVHTSLYYVDPSCITCNHCVIVQHMTCFGFIVEPIKYLVFISVACLQTDWAWSAVESSLLHPISYFKPTKQIQKAHKNKNFSHTFPLLRPLDLVGRSVCSFYPTSRSLLSVFLPFSFAVKALCRQSLWVAMWCVIYVSSEHCEETPVIPVNKEAGMVPCLFTAS